MVLASGLRFAYDRWSRRNGDAPGVGSPYPSWEIQVFGTQILGLAESIGFAFGLACSDYLAIASLLTFLIVAVIFALAFFLRNGMHRRQVCEYVPSEGSISSRFMTAYHDGSTNSNFLKKSLNGLLAAANRGEWKVSL